MMKKLIFLGCLNLFCLIVLRCVDAQTVVLQCPKPTAIHIYKNKQSNRIESYYATGHLQPIRGQFQKNIRVSGYTNSQKLSRLYAASYNYDGDSYSVDCLYQGDYDDPVLFTYRLSKWFKTCRFKSDPKTCVGDTEDCQLICETHRS